LTVVVARGSSVPRVAKWVGMTGLFAAATNETLELLNVTATSYNSTKVYTGGNPGGRHGNGKSIQLKYNKDAYHYLYTNKILHCIFSQSDY